MSKFFGIATVFVLHGGGLHEFTRRFPSWSKRVLRRSDVVVTPSKFLARSAQNHGLPTHVIPNVIDLADYQFRLRRNIDPRMIWMRTFHSIYNPAMALRVLDIVRSRKPDATLVMAGVDKGMEDQIKILARQMGLEGIVTFPGFLDQEAKLTVFSDGDIYLNTNNVDNMPVSVVEACAMGLPVVATNVGGIPDLISDGLDGILVPADDEQKMADAVLRLLDDPELAERLSRNGRVLAERSSWESVRKQWEEIFAEVTGKAGSPSTERAAVTTH